MAGIYINIDGSRSPVADTSSKSRPGIALSNALCKEISFYAPTHGLNETIEAIHIGGHPEIVREEGIRAIAGTLFSSFDALNVQEFSIDITPSTFDLNALQGLVALGINTVNIRAGSFFESDLDTLGLTHSPEDILATIEQCKRVGIRKISIELNIGIENQPPEYWAANMEKAIGLDIQHVSIKGMSIFNQDTPTDQLASCFSFPAESEDQVTKFSFASHYLLNAGFEHYVLSGFAKNEHRSKLRELQLFHGNVLGIGPEAHSFWWVNGSQASRWSNVDNIAYYQALINQQELPVDARSMLDIDTLANEYIFLRIQHAEGLDLLRLESEYGLDLLTERIEELAWLESEGYIEPIRNNRVRLSQYGKIHSRNVFTRILV